MDPVVLESPFRTRVLNLQGKQIWLTEDDNLEYAYACMRDCFERGESPFASHVLFTQVLDDKDPEQRELGLRAGGAISKAFSKRVVYTDRGISFGMAGGILEARDWGQEVEYRELGGSWAIFEIASLSVEELLNEVEQSRD